MMLPQWTLLLLLITLTWLQEVIGLLNDCDALKCINGNCQNGICVCSSCYTGSSCELMDNVSPIFKQSSYEFLPLTKPSINDILGKVTADDKDSDKCSSTPCACTIVIYSIINDVNNAIFTIDHLTGELILSKNDLNIDYEYSIDVKATNESPFDNIYDSATIFVKFGKINTDVNERLGRFKRAATAPGTLAFLLVQVNPVAALTVAQIGQLISFTLTITFPVGFSSLTVELFAPIATSPVMMICNAQVSTTGSAITPFSISAPVLQGVTGGPIWPYTQVIYTITNQNNAQASPATLADIQAVISFDTYMLYYPTTPNSTLYYVSAGAEYLNATQIWVGQSGYSSAVTVPTPSPTISIVGDTAIYPGSTAAFDVIIVSPDYYLQLNIGFYTPFNDTMVLSFCTVYRYYMGASFSCIPTTFMQPTLTNFTSNSIVYYPTAYMNLSYVTNQLKQSNSGTGPDKDTIKIKMTLRTNPLSWPSGTSYIGVSASVTATNIISAVQSLPIQTKPPKVPYTGSINALLSFYNNVNTAIIGSVSQILLSITVPQNSELDYIIQASFNSLNTEICGFQFLSAGANVPCINQVILNPLFTTSADNYQVMANVTIPNIRSVPFSNLSSDNVIQILISFRPINDVRNSAGNNIVSNVVLLWNGGQSAPLSNTLLLQAANPTTNISNTNVPTFTFQMLGSDGNISALDARTMFFSMVLVPGIVYQPATLQFYMPFNVTARMKICQATITFIGSNIVCFAKLPMISKFAYSSRANDNTTYDTLSIAIGTLCTAGPIGRTPTADDSISIQMDILILTHTMNIVGALTTINAGMLITSNQIWVGNQNIQFITPATPPALAAPNIPTISGSRIDNNANIVWQNDMAILQYIIKVAGNSRALITFSVTSDIVVADNFGVCNISVIQKGNSIPCIQTTTTSTPWTPLSKYNKVYTMQFSTIINSGTLPLANPSFDANSILLEVPVKFGPSLPATFNVVATLTYNGPTVTFNIPFTLQTTLSRINGTILANEPVFDFNLMPLFNATPINVTVMGYGEALRGSLTVLLKPSTIQTLSFSFVSIPYSTGQMDIISVNILSVGANIPCLQPGMMKYYTTQRTGSTTLDMTTLNLGTVCRRDVISSSSPSDNSIVIEVVFRVWRMPLNSPTTLDLNSLTLVNNDEIFIIKITVNVAPVTAHITDTNQLNLNVSFVASLSTNVLAIGQNVSVNVSIILPPFSQYSSAAFRIFAIWPVGSDSALIVSDTTNFTGTFGKNVLVNSAEQLRMSSWSSTNTSQLDSISANLGITQNPATTYRFGQENYTATSPSDSITLQFNIRATDSIVAANAYAYNIIMGVVFGSNMVNQSIPITISRTNLETITINGTTTLLTNNSLYTQNDEVRISVIAQLINGSKLECRNFTVYVASPSFMTLTSVQNTSFTSPGIAIQQTSLSLGGYSFNVPFFFATEQIKVTFGLTLKANTTLSRQRQQSKAVIPIIYGCKTLNWPSNPQGNKYVNTATDVKIVLQGNPIVLAGCNSDLKVSDNTVITDCAISAYLAPFATFDALKIRSNSGAMWKPHIRGGYYNKFRYIDIVFGTLKTVASVIVTSTHANLPQEIAIYGTMDGRAYSYHTASSLVFVGAVATVSLTSPSFNYYGIRISVTKTLINDSETGLNIDLTGCPIINVTAPAIAACPVPFIKPVTTLTNFYRRGYLYMAPHLFVCDDVPVLSTSLETYPRCFRTLDTTPTVWQDMGPYIGKVVGYDINSKTVYGIDADLKSFVMSIDDGVTWTGLNENGWKLAKALNSWPSPTEILWTTPPGFYPNLNGTSCTTYVAGAWNFCYDGVYNAGSNKLSWNTCCSLP